MISDLSLSLRAMLARGGTPPELANAQIVFDHPSDSFSPSQTTVNLFLYDIREDTELRTSEREIEQTRVGVLLRPPAIRVACSYLVTAWPVGGQEQALQEQRLLSQVLITLRRHPIMPAAVLQGALREQSEPMPMLAAQNDQIKDPSEFWTAIGNKMRPSITVRVTIPLGESEAVVPAAGIVQSHDIRLSQSATAGRNVSTEPVRLMATIGGRVIDADEQPAPGLSMTLTKSNRSAATDAEGRFILRRVVHGLHTLQIHKAGVLLKELAIMVPAATGQGYDFRLD